MKRKKDRVEERDWDIQRLDLWSSILRVQLFVLGQGYYSAMCGKH